MDPVGSLAGEREVSAPRDEEGWRASGGSELISRGVSVGKHVSDLVVSVEVFCIGVGEAYHFGFRCYLMRCHLVCHSCIDRIL